MNILDSTNTDSQELESLAQQSEYMQQLIGEVDELPEMPSKALMQNCIEEILTFHNNGLQRILRFLIRDDSTASARLLNHMLEDPFITGLLLMHDLHPQPELLEAELTES